MRRETMVRVLVSVLVLLTAACRPEPVPGLPTGWSGTFITRDGADSFVMASGRAGHSELFRVRGPVSNRGSNTRLIARPSDAPTSRDHEVCATATSTSWLGQEGVALRDRLEPDRHRVITVTKNVYGGATTVYNVHLWDSRRPGVGTHIAQVNKAAAFTDVGLVPRVPRRLCAQVAGSRLTFKVWSQDRAEPGWADPVHATSVELPREWVFEGRPATYVGHVAANQTLTLSDIVTRRR